jgi:hypothetical protein
MDFMKLLKSLDDFLYEVVARSKRPREFFRSIFSP